MQDEKLIYRIEHGSRMYGTSTPTSDTDYKEVYVPSGRSILLQRVKAGRASGPEKAASEKNKPGDIDTNSFAVTKLFHMLTKGDIIGWELIFTPWSSIIYSHPWYSEIVLNYEIFLNRNVDGYVGYCRQQANKYGIRGSRIAAVRGMVNLLTDLAIKPDGNINGVKKIDDAWLVICDYCISTPHCEIEMIENGSTKQMIPHVVCCGKKQPIHNTIKQAIDCYQHVLDQYGQRALQAEKNEGIDWKAVSHAVRVGEQAIELLETGWITFPRPNAKYLLEVKRGELPYQKIADQLDELLIRVEDASAKSKLPEKPNQEAIDELIVDLHRRML